MEITLTNIPLNTTPEVDQVAYMAWKIQGDPDSSYNPLPDAIIDPTGAIIDPDPYVFVTGTTTENIVVRAINACDEENVITAVFDGLVEPIWIGGAYVCEQDDPIILEDTFAGFSSPQTLYWDNTLGRFYVVDLDDVGGNLYWFDPDTFTGFGDQTYVPGSAVPGQFVNAHDFDPVQRKIFFAGDGTSGVYVHNIATGVTSHIPDGGTNGAFARLLCRLLNGKLYVSNKFDSTITIINPVTQVVESVLPVGSIPGNSGNPYFNNSYQMYGVNGEIWVCAGGFRATNGNIARYSTDLSTFLGELTVPSVASPGGAWPGYWQTQYYDAPKQRFYLSDTGSRLNTVFDVVALSVETQTPINNNEGKAFGLIAWVFNTLTSQLYANQSSQDTPAGAVTNKFYIQDRDTYQYLSMFTAQSVSGLSLKGGTGEFWAAAPGLVGWAPGPPPGWNTDGQIFKYTL